jgi:hypothetical protein
MVKKIKKKQKKKEKEKKKIYRARSDRYFDRASVPPRKIKNNIEAE